MSHTTRSPEETEKLAIDVAAGLKPGDRVALVGELGGGKTCFVRGLAKGLGAKGPVRSPSFTIMNVYTGGRVELYHLDLYRLSSAGEVFDAGLEEFIYGRGVAVIEWADRAPGILDECNLVVSFSHAGGDVREIEVRADS